MCYTGIDIYYHLLCMYTCIYNIDVAKPSSHFRRLDVVSSCLGAGAERQAAGVCRRGKKHIGGGDRKTTEWTHEELKYLGKL